MSKLGQSQNTKGTLRNRRPKTIIGKNALTLPSASVTDDPRFQLRPSLFERTPGGIHLDDGSEDDEEGMERSSAGLEDGSDARSGKNEVREGDNEVDEGGDDEEVWEEGSSDGEIEGNRKGGEDVELDDDASTGDSDNDTPHESKLSLNLPLLSSAKPLTAKSLAKYQAKIDASGVVYLSRIPPFMKPEKLRTLLARYGSIGRIYLVPEDPKIAARRKKYKHNRRQNFTEGWVEFADKQVARSVADLLNGKQIGGKKRSRYYDDIWNIKYLPRFKWNHLSEQIAYELKVRDQRLKAEMAQAKRENKAYVKNVEKAKMIEGMVEKKQRKRKAEEGGDADEGVGNSSGGGSATTFGEADGTEAIRRRFKQRKVIDSDANDFKSKTGKTSALLGRIFA